jgi:hypothetical protein
MNIKMLSGSIYCDIDVDLHKEYNYNELKDLFKNINGYFSIVQGNDVIYTNLYEDIFIMNNKVKLYDLTIVFLPYKKNDLDKVKCKYPCDPSLFNFYKKEYDYMPKKINNLTTEFELSEPNLDNDELFMMYCVSLDGILLSYASDELKNNTNLVYYAYKKNVRSFQYASNDIKNNKKLLMKCYSIPLIFKYLSDLKSDKEIVFNALKTDFHNIRYVDPDLINNIEFVKQLIQLQWFNCSIFKYFNYNLKNDKEIIMKCIEAQNSNIEKKIKYYYPQLELNDIGIKLQYDRDIIFECLKFNGSQLKNIPNDFELDNELILLGLNQGFSKIECDDEYQNILEYIDKPFRKNKQIVISAIRRHGNNYHYASKQLKNDPDVIIEAINNCWFDIDADIPYYRSYEFKNDLKKIDNEIQKILNSTNVRNKKISSAIIDKLRKQII